MKDDEFKYVRLENSEGVLTKKYLLSTQMNLLRILKAIKGYHQIRQKELKIKAKLLNSIKEVSQDIKKIQLNVPKLTTSFPKEEQEEMKVFERRDKGGREKTGPDRDLEMQLMDIQEKLRALQI